jgi:hypothetical protein
MYQRSRDMVVRSTPADLCNGWHQHAVLLLLSTCLFCLYRNLYLRSGDTIPDSIGNITTLQYLCERTTVLFPFCLQTDY